MAGTIPVIDLVLTEDDGSETNEKDFTEDQIEMTVVVGPMGFTAVLVRVFG